MTDYSSVHKAAGLTAVDEWLILSKRNFRFDLGDVLLFLPSDKTKTH